MTAIHAITLEVPDTDLARAFYTAVLGAESPIRLRTATPPTTGFRAFTLSLVVDRPADVDRIFDEALAAGAAALKPVARSLWGYGGVFRAPDGAIWKVATTAKKETGPATGRIDDIVLLLGVEDVLASKRFYVGRGFTVDRSFGRKYVQFDAPVGAVKLALYGRRALAKDAGVPPEGTGAHRLVVAGDAGPFTDPDGFAWEEAADARIRRRNANAR